MAQESRGEDQEKLKASTNKEVAEAEAEPAPAEASASTAAAVAAAAAAAAASSGEAGFKLNIHAPEFVPRSHVFSGSGTPFPAPLCYPYFHLIGSDYGGTGASAGSAATGPDQWIYFADREPVVPFLSDFTGKAAGNAKGGNDVTQKIVKQVEYQFSDTNLVANDFLMKIMNKDPEGYVPMSVVASWKKIKALGANNYMLVKALRTSTKLVVSEDGKKIKRKQLFTERDKEELQSRIVVVENLPEDYSRQSLEKTFSVAGSVKNIRICHPQDPSSAPTSKTDMLISNKKLHALVEFETREQAEKAVEKLNDEGNWRKGLRVRTMIRFSPKSVIRTKKSEFDHFDMYSEDDPSPTAPASPRLDQLPLDHNAEENQGGTRKAWGRGRGKSLAPINTQSGRGLLTGPSLQAAGAGEASSKLGSPHGPRMPDGTRGFTMGRGKPDGPVLGRAPAPSPAALASAQQ